MPKPSLFFLFVTTVLVACTPKQEPIAYGESQCSYCKMTVVDRIHGAEIVTDKGKVYVYDSVECMLNDRREKPEVEIAYFLVNYYEQPAALTDATNAIYLVSKELPSPMGGYLTAFSTQAKAENALVEFGGKLYSWDEINQAYNK